MKLNVCERKLIFMPNCIIAQSGGPTSVINSSVVGLIKANDDLKLYDKVYGGLNGIEGILNKNIIDLSCMSSEDKEVFKILSDGFILNREDRTQKDLYIQLIDFDNIENNIFKVVNQNNVSAFNKRRRGPLNLFIFSMTSPYSPIIACFSTVYFSIIPEIITLSSSR